MDETLNSGKRRADQDQRMANCIAAARQRLETVQVEPDLSAILATMGYDAARLAEGLALQETAQAAYQARQTAMAAQTEASQAQQTARETAHTTYMAFRATARALFHDDAARTALGLNNHNPRDLEKFLTQARAAYATAAQGPYAATFAAYGYDAPAFDALQATLNELSTADETQNIASGTAQQATAARNTAVEHLDTWMLRFQRLARVALRDRHALQVKLDL